MKISETTSYPHPVLAHWKDDIVDATFRTELNLREDAEDQLVDMHCDVVLDQPDIVRLIENGDAKFGCFIVCKATGLRRFQDFGFPSGSHQFAPGALLGQVRLRPMVLSAKRITGYAPVGGHPEFGCASDIEIGQFLALDDELQVCVLRPPIPSVESIFEIKSSKEVEDEVFQIDLSGDRIYIMMGEGTYYLVQQLRNPERNNSSVIMNSLFVPVVMEVLSMLAEDPDQYSDLRWYEPFMQRCDQLGVDPKSKSDLLTNAQKLLEKPFALLEQMIKAEETEDE